MAWGKNGTPDTLTSAGDTLTISDLTTTKFNQFMSHVISSSTIDIDITFDNNTATDYARRQSYNGGSDSTNTSQSNIQYSNNVTDTEFMIMYGVNINSEEKLFIMFQNRSNTAGAGNAPNRYEMVAKIDTTTNTGQYTRVDINNTEAGSYDTNSNLSAIGSDITPAAAVPFPTNVQVGSRAEITDTRKMYSLTDPLIADDDFTSYADQTAFDNSWVTSNTAKFRGNPTNDNIDILNSNAYDNIYYDLGSVSDTKWLCRFKVTLTTAGSQSLGFCYFYVGSTTGDANESNDGLGFYFYDGANNTYALADNGNRPDQTSVTGALGINPSTTTYYAEMKRTSATSFTVTLYSDSSYSISLGTATLTISSGITGLRYFKIMGYTTTGGLVGTFDDFKFYNNSTDTSNYWQEIGA